MIFGGAVRLDNSTLRPPSCSQMQHPARAPKSLPAPALEGGTHTEKNYQNKLNWNTEVSTNNVNFQG